MATVAQNIRDNRARDIQQQVAAGSFGAPEAEQIAPGIPVSNDAALAAHLKESRDKSAEYARLRTEEAREQWEGMVSANYQREQANKQNIAEQVSNAKANQEHEHKIVGDSLALQMQELTDTFPPNWSPETLPLDKLHQLSNLRQKVQDLARATGTQGLQDGVLESGGPLAPANVLGLNTPRPETFPDGQAVRVTQNQDGTLHVEYATGEKFDGDPLTVTQRIGQAHVSTKRWAQQQRAQQSQPALQPEPIQQPAPQTEPTEQNYSGSLSQDLAARQADALAQQFGFSDKNEMLQWGEKMTRTAERVKDYDDQLIATEFMSRCPDFPQTEQTNTALLGIVDANGWQYTPENLQAAHLMAVNNGVYQPLTQQQIRAANGEPIQVNRPTPPPMLGGNNPELASGGNNDPWSMSMGDLRKQAIRQELEGHR